eukprot:Pgem_evm1s15978
MEDGQLKVNHLTHQDLEKEASQVSEFFAENNFFANIRKKSEKMVLNELEKQYSYSFLTGVTGFVGAFLLRGLILQDYGK